MTPAPGDIVLYTLDAADVEQITARRANFQLHNQGRSGHKHPHSRDVHKASGHIAHIGTPVTMGDVLPAVVTRVPDPPNANLRVLLDGSDTQWATGVPPGDGPGAWRRRS
jgi:hypothetical protein